MMAKAVKVAQPSKKMWRFRSKRATKRSPFMIAASSLILSSHATAAVALTSPAKIFCFGDSLTAGTSPPLNQEFPYAKHLEEGLCKVAGLESTLVRWRGYPGWTSSALLNDGGLGSILDGIHSKLNSKVDLVIILGGTNDLAYGREAQEIFNDLIGLHQEAHSKGCKTIALSIPTSGWQAKSESAKMLAGSVNAKLESLSNSTGDRKMTFVPFPVESFDPGSGMWSPDGLHFSADGYEFIGKSLVSHVSHILTTRAGD